MELNLREYFGDFKASDEFVKNASDLLLHVNPLLTRAESEKVRLEINPATGSLISGQKFGGFRPKDCPIGAPGSAHKIGKAVDIYDRHNLLDQWITDEILTEFNLYRESPDATDGWVHLSTKAPASGHRTFIP